MISEILKWDMMSIVSCQLPYPCGLLFVVLQFSETGENGRER